MNRLLLLIIGLSFCTLSFGQNNKEVSWKAFKKQAEELIELRQFGKAAAAYEEAYTLKPQRGDLLIRASENYIEERDFNNASRVLAKVVNNPKYKKSRLDYAYSLKQSNQYEEAMLMFAAYLNDLDKGNTKVEAQINKEIMGCQFALEQKEGYVVKPYGIDIKQFSLNVNTPETEFAPFYVSDTKMYYSSLVNNKASIQASSYREGDWSEGKLLKGLSGLKSKHICNAVLNEEATEMFFTICNEDQVWGGLSTKCNIYVSEKKGKAWGQAQKLNKNVNYEGSTNTQPFVLEKDGVQQLYFASNRPNGQGGMDLWFAARPIGQKEFGEAVNLGPNVNTAGNEITPFVSEKEGALYFSSDGHLTMGGFDVNKSVGSEFSWSKAENLGLPINTGADEKYYKVSRNNTEGFFVSNRTFGQTKTSPTDEDIFTFNILPPHFFVEGVVTDGRDLSYVDEAKIYLYELKEKTQDRRLLSVQKVKAGNYNFRLLPKRSYQLSVEAEGFAQNVTFVNTNDENLYLQEKNIELNTDAIQEPVASINDVLPVEPVEEEVAEAPTEAIVEEVAAAPMEEVEKVIEEPLEEVAEVPTEAIIEEVVEAPIEKVVESPIEEVAKIPAEAMIEEVVEAPKEMVDDFAIDASTAAHENMPKEEVIAAQPIIEEVKSAESTVVAVEEAVMEQAIIKEVKTEETKIEEVVKEEAIISETVTPSTTVSTETYIRNSVVAESSYKAKADFVSKGNAKVPSGTGIYNYDTSNDVYKKEGTLLSDRPIKSYSEPVTYSGTTSTYSASTSVAPIEVPLDKYDINKNKSYSSSNSTATNTSSSSKLMGTTYKVQLIAVEYHNPNNRRYDGIKNLGLNMNTEYIEGKGWTRVMLGSFKTESEAKSILENAQRNGFKRAFLVQYVDGQRNKRIR